jgi:predicted Rossmann fold flavoprotein
VNKRVVIVGGGAAGFFAAITCAEQNPGVQVMILEKTAKVLEKVRISGGGRCNVTHACFDPRELTRNYPRGERELIGPYHRFQAEDTVRWFHERGVRLKTEADGRMFPITDSSQTIIDCLIREVKGKGVEIRTNCGVSSVSKKGETFQLELSPGESLICDRLLLATGGCRTAALGQIPVSLGHTLVPPVPSLFTFHIEVPWVRELAGVTVPEVELSVPETKLAATGPLLFTHWGISGPAVLRLSAWGARTLHAQEYKFMLRVKWSRADSAALAAHARASPAKLVVNSALPPLPSRIWTALVNFAGLPRERRWSGLTRAEHQRLLETISATTLPVTGKSLNKDEFVTCGGVALDEVNFKTMESKICPGLYFAGELLDIDGLTGGFNFQAAWTTGWIAGFCGTNAAAGNSARQNPRLLK